MIELRNIDFSYGDKVLLRGINVTVEDNDFMGIVGCNGCGKTTLVKLMLGLLKPQQGEILFSKNGKRVERLSMGYLPQITTVDRKFPMSVREVVALGLVDKGSVFRAYLKQSERDAVDKVLLRMNIMPFANKPIAELSGGELQRVLLARAVVMKPDVLVLDEPNTYLDYNSENRLYEYLTELNRKCAIVLVGHDVHNIKRFAKHIVSVNSPAEINTMPML